MKLADMTAVQLLNELNAIYREIRRRHDDKEDGDVAILNDGTVRPRRCPSCEIAPFVQCVELNLSPEQVETINTSTELVAHPWERWHNFFERERKAGGMPQKPYGWVFDPLDRLPHDAGKYYMVSCGCHVSDWKKSEKEAEEDYWRTHQEAALRLNTIPKGAGT